MDVRSFIFLPLIAACATGPSVGVPVTGEWGGRHVGLSLTSSGGTLEYDCASGTITGPLIPTSSGSFAAEGVHAPAAGGPEIEGQVLPRHAVRYTGRIRGGTMNLVGRLDNGVILGPFELRRDAEPIIFRCL
ncbi:MAG TPA: hypothetical protein VFO69_05325 [Allosphingosinicella sp.]|nr:hypothetical protein [Allosphingosinicella sp.]